MSAGEARTPRGKARGNDEAQGTLEDLLGGSAAKDSADQAAVSERPPGRPVKAGAAGTDPLRGSLDALEESVKLLLARHVEAVGARSAAEARRRSAEALDPVALQERVHTLEAEADRLERHTAFLEDRIRGLLSRVRYLIES